MKILLVSDEESAFLWDHYQPGRLDGIDLILSAGDLSPHYLSFLVTMGRAPVYYVHGNHDGRYAKQPPEGCESLEDRVVNIGGLRILGLGGSQRYCPGEHQYTEEEMRRRISKLRRQLRKSGGVDVVVSHAPVRGFGDDDSFAHRGFECFRELMQELRPKYWVYGHVHLRYSVKAQRVMQWEDTTLINACEKYLLDTDA